MSKIFFYVFIISQSINLFGQSLYENMREEFPGGEDSLNCFFERNLNFNILNSSNKKGKVYLYLRIDTAGYSYNSVTNPKLIKGFENVIYDQNIEEEILRVVRIMPKWSPAIMNYKKINVTRLISFEIPYKDFKCKKP